MNSILAHTIVAIATLSACCYIYTLNNHAESAVFTVIGSVAGYYFGRMINNNNGSS